MNQFVCVKRVPDTAANIRIDDQGRIQTGGLEFVTSPYDEYALEEAVQIREEREDGEVVVVSLGGSDAEKTIRDCLARGADRGIHLQNDASDWDPYATARALADTLSDETPDLIWFGKHAADDDGYQVGQIVASLMELPVATFVSDVEVDGSEVRVKRETEGGFDVLTLERPCVLTTEKGLNEPRYAKLQAIMKAKNKEIEQREVSDPEPATRVHEMEPPPERPPGEIVGEGPGAVPELVRKLHEDANVI